MNTHTHTVTHTQSHTHTHSHTHTQSHRELPHLRDVGVVEEPEDDAGQGVDHLVVVRGGDDLGQRVLQCVAQDAVEGQVGAVDLLLQPLVAPQVADLGPQAVQVLATTRRKKGR